MQQVEHLVLIVTAKTFGGFALHTKDHKDLGNNLQAALTFLETDGWQVVTSVYNPPQLTQIILTRSPR